MNRWLTLVSVAMVALGLLGCERREGPSARKPGDKPVIVVSIAPLASLTNYLVDGWAEVRTLLPPGSSPHGFELTPAQLRSLSDADVLVVVGLNLDAWAERAARDAARPGLPVLRFADLVGVHGDEHGHDEHADHDHDHAHDHRGPNPHLWVDPVLASKFVDALAHKLEALFLDRAQSLRMRSMMTQSELAKLDAIYRQQLGGVPVKQLVTFHNAFDPLAERYGLQVVAHLTEIDIAPGGEVAPRQLIEVIEAVEKYQLKVIYAEPQFPDTAMNAVRQQTGVTILRLDAHGHAGIEGHLDYIKLMESNLRTLVEGQTLAATASAPAQNSHEH